MNNIRDINNLLESFSKIYPKLSFIKSINKVYQHNDVPNFYAYAAVLSNSSKDTDGHIKDITRASGISFESEELALLKCFGEVVERYSSTTYKNKDLIYEPYRNIKDKAIDPNQFFYFSQRQLKDSRYGIFNNKAILHLDG